MTPALKAMVEAMDDEIARQVAAHDGDPAHARYKTRQGQRTHIPPIGIDLEKVARAGLEAIKEPGDLVLAAALPIHPEVGQDEVRDALGWMIDAILKEQL